MRQRNLEKVRNYTKFCYEMHALIYIANLKEFNNFRITAKKSKLMILTERCAMYSNFLVN